MSPMRTRWCGVLTALACSGVALAGQPAEPAVVGLVGDSLAWLVAQPDALPAAVSSGVRVVAAPAPGSSVISWANGEHDAQVLHVKHAHPVVTLVVLGSNDAYMRAYTIEREGPFIARVLAKLQGCGEVVWVGPPKLKHAMAGVEMLVGLLRASTVPVLDSRTVALTFWEDALHPDRAGRQRWARWMWEQVHDKVKP